MRDEADKIVDDVLNDDALKEIRSFLPLSLGYVTIFVAVFATPIIGLTFGVDKLFKANIKTDVYEGAIAFAASLAFVGEAIAFADNRRKQSIDRQTFYNLRIAELPEVGFEDCYFEDCTFKVNLSTAVFERCSFFECRFSSSIGRSVENSSFRDCDFSGATIDPGFFFRHNTRRCDFSHTKIEEIYPHSEYPSEGWIGSLSCDHNARSPFLRCAINPTGPCNECSDFSPAVFAEA